MSYIQPATDGVKALIRHGGQIAKTGMNKAQSAVSYVKSLKMPDIMNKDNHGDNLTMRQAMMNGVQNIYNFPEKATQVIAAPHMQNTITQIGRMAPQPVLIGLAGLAGANIVVGAHKNLTRRKQSRMPSLLYAVPIFVGGMIASEQTRRIVQDYQSKNDTKPEKK